MKFRPVLCDVKVDYDGELDRWLFVATVVVAGVDVAAT